jgi:hypothetical protein
MGRSRLAGSAVEEAFEAAVAPLFADPRVGRGRKQLCCEVADKVFAMVSGGRIVVKLPRARVEELVGQGAGDYFQLGSRTMKEWLALGPAADPAGLVVEAREFVGG